MEKKESLEQIHEEGRVKFLSSVEKNEGETEQVFYNPVQNFNRDLSLLVTKVWGKQSDIKGGLSFYDALSASG